MAVAVLAACGASSGPPATVNYKGSVLHLGAVLSLTGAGGSIGQEQQKAIALAVDQLNNTGGVAGAKVSIDVVDDGSDQQQGVQVTQDLIQAKKVLGIIGPSLANTALLADPAAQKLKTPVILPSVTGSGLVGQCGQPCDYIFRDSLGETAAIPANVKAATARTHPHTAALFYAIDDKASADGAATFQQAFADNGVALPTGGVQSFAKTETAFTTYVASALALKADIWAVSAQGAVPAALIAEARTQGFKGPILGGNGFNSYAVSMHAGVAGKGAASASAYYAGIDSSANKQFVAAYSAKYKDTAGKAILPGAVAAQAYAAVLLFAEGGRRARLAFGDRAADRTRLRDALAGGWTTDTPMGNLGFTPEHDVRQPIYIVAMDGKGGFDLLATTSPG